MRFCACGCGGVVDEGRTCSRRPEGPRFIHGHNRRKPAADRFWAKVAKGAAGECWAWAGSRNRLGYGQFRAGCTTLAHRFSYELHFGPVPGGLLVCHECDNPACVNPAHLFLGDDTANVADMVAKERQAKGELHGIAKLAAASVTEIRRRHATGASLASLAEEFGVQPTAILKIVRGHRWKHLLRPVGQELT